MRLFSHVAILVGLAGWSGANPLHPSALDSISPRDDPVVSRTGRKLQGRFLHITDFHPDPFYKLHSSTEKEGACHRGSGPAGTYGAETTACDSPFSLINATFDWIAANIKDKVDFVIWTGDSARHDNDDLVPRSRQQVLDLNRFMVDKFVSVFGSDGDPSTEPLTVPIVPTFGNNDILPHNIMTPGPNVYTRRYLDIWRHFIPEEQRHGFARGGWFFVETIPNKLAIFSLNTLYFFDSNSAVDGCADPSEPGYEHMDWLRIQLQLLRERGMKAILTGHVPPARSGDKRSWDETCWQKYTLWLQQYRDVIVGGVYGHMNIDHFMLQDGHDINVRQMLDLDDVEEVDADDEGEIVTSSAEDYLQDLQKSWSKIPDPPPELTYKLSNFIGHASQAVLEFNPWRKSGPSLGKSNKKKKKGAAKKEFYKKMGGHWAERYSLTLVSPSIVPNYFPTLRIVEYNITGLENESVGSVKPAPASSVEEVESDLIDGSFVEDADVDASKKHKKKKKHHKKHSKDPKFTPPKPPSKSSPPGPAYSPQPLSWLSYAQYYANLTYINNDLIDVKPSFPPPSTSSPSSNETLLMIDDTNWSPNTHLFPARWHSGKNKDKHPHRKHPHPHPKNFTFEVEYDTANVDDAFGLSDLTVRSFVGLARRIGTYKAESYKDVDLFDERELVEEIEDSLSDEEETEGGVDAANKKKHKKKKEKKKKRRKDAAKAWLTFAGRAFVSTLSKEELEERFAS